MILKVCTDKKCSFCGHMTNKGGIEKMKGGGTIATGDGILVFRMLTIRSALKLEAHGFKLKGRRSVMKQVKKEFGITGSRESIMRQFEAILLAHGFEFNETRQKSRTIDTEGILIASGGAPQETIVEVPKTAENLTVQ